MTMWPPGTVTTLQLGIAARTISTAASGTTSESRLPESEVIRHGNLTVDAGRRITALKSKNDVDIAKISISGGGLLITYECKHKDDTSCSQTICLCTAGSALTSIPSMKPSTTTRCSAP